METLHCQSGMCLTNVALIKTLLQNVSLQVRTSLEYHLFVAKSNLPKGRWVFFLTFFSNIPTCSAGTLCRDLLYWGLVKKTPLYSTERANESTHKRSSLSRRSSSEKQRQITWGCGTEDRNLNESLCFWRKAALQLNANPHQCLCCTSHFALHKSVFALVVYSLLGTCQQLLQLKNECWNSGMHWKGPSIAKVRCRQYLNGFIITIIYSYIIMVSIHCE